MRIKTNIDLLENERVYCDALEEVLNIELPEDVRSTVYKRGLIVERNPDRAGKFLKYLLSIIEEDQDDLEEESNDSEGTFAHIEVPDSLKKRVTLTAYQNKTLSRLRDLLDKEKFAVLAGFAGVGKTTLLNYVGDLGYKNIQFLAPTNKAAGVLRKKLDKKYHGCITIHKWMKITPKQNGEIVEWKKADISRIHKALKNLDLIVIDEASMLNKELLKLLEEIILNNPSIRSKILFVGDSYQLPPVGEEKSLVFDYPTVWMKKIVRQAKDSPIIKASMQIREAIDANDMNMLLDSLSGFPEAGPEQIDLYNQLTENPDIIRTVAYTNNSVGQHNRIIRNKIGQKGYGDLTQGDLATAYNPMFSTKEQLSVLEEGIICIDEYIPSFYVSDDFWVEDIKYAEFDGDPFVEIKHKGSLDKIRLSDLGIDPKLNLIHYDLFNIEDKIHFKTTGIENSSRLLNSIAEVAKLSEGPVRNGAWSLFHNLKAFADLRPGYGLTCHKVQGSTFNNVIIDVDNIKKCPDFQTMARLLYVAVTRASENVYIH